MPLGKRWKQMTEINKCPFWVSENVLILLLLFQAAALLVWERAGLELWCRGRFGPPSFTAKAKVTVTALGPSGRGMGPHWGMSRRLSDGGGDLIWRAKTTWTYLYPLQSEWCLFTICGFVLQLLQLLNIRKVKSKVEKKGTRSCGEIRAAHQVYRSSCPNYQTWISCFDDI